MVVNLGFRANLRPQTAKPKRSDRVGAGAGNRALVLSPPRCTARPGAAAGGGVRAPVRRSGPPHPPVRRPAGVPARAGAAVRGGAGGRAARGGEHGSAPQPETLYPKPQTLSPQPSTLNPQPSTLNPQPSTFNPQPSTLNPQHSILDPQPSTVNH